MTPLELRAARRQLGYNQTRLAERLGLTQKTVSDWETGKAPFKEVVAIAVNCLLKHGKEMEK